MSKLLSSLSHSAEFTLSVAEWAEGKGKLLGRLAMTVKIRSRSAFENDKRDWELLNK